MYGVIFDMDGVLVLTAEAHFQSWQNVGRKHGARITYELFSSCFGRTNTDCIRVMIDPNATDATIREIAEQKESEYRDIIRAAIPLAPGTRDVLAALAGAGFRLAIGSSAPRENLDLVLDGTGIRGRFSGIVDGSMVRRGKPAPDVFLMAAEQLGLPPARCAVIEDAPAGIEAARAAGMAAIGIATTHDAAALREAGAHTVLDSLGQLGPELAVRLLTAGR